MPAATQCGRLQLRTALSRHARATPVMAISDPYSGMKRADLPLNEELVALQVLGGSVGFVVFSGLSGSTVLGVALGILAGRWLAFEPGRRGASARELGYLLAQLRARHWHRVEGFCRSVQLHVSSMRVPADVRGALSGAAGRAWAEVRALDECLRVSSRARALGGRVSSLALRWADETGMSARLSAAWYSSPVRASLHEFERRVNERLK